MITPTRAETVTADADRFREVVAAFGPGVVVTGDRGGAFEAAIKGYELGRIGLMRVRTRNLWVRHDPRESVSCVNIPLSGTFRTGDTEGGGFGPGTAPILGPGRRLDIRTRAGSVLVVRMSEAHLAALSERLCNGDGGCVECSATLEITRPSSRPFWQRVRKLWAAADAEGPHWTGPRLTELEESLATEFLVASGRLEPRPALPPRRSGAAHQLRRTEDWIEANLDQVISRATLCEVAGVNLRSLSRLFREHRGVGPMQFVRGRRLEAAHRELLGRGPGETTITEVALAYGFYHMGRFAAEYRRAFRESPSQTLVR